MATSQLPSIVNELLRLEMAQISKRVSPGKLARLSLNVNRSTKRKVRR